MPVLRHLLTLLPFGISQCDIESYIYMPLIEELGYMPTEKYARAKELLKHSEMIGRRWGLYERTLFQTEVLGMR